jgi:hypothetical protein
VARSKAALDAFPPPDAGPRDYKAFNIGPVLFGACAGIVRDPDCRHGWEMAARASGASAYDALLASCRSAYCADADALVACGSPGTGTPRERVAAGGQLLALILQRDAPADGATIATALQAARRRIPDLPPPSLSGTSTPSSPGLRLFLTGDSVKVTDSRGRVLGDVAVVDLGGWLTKRDDLAEFRDATITASPGTEYTNVIRAIDGLRAVGIMDVHFGVPR